MITVMVKLVAGARQYALSALPDCIHLVTLTTSYATNVYVQPVPRPMNSTSVARHTLLWTKHVFVAALHGGNRRTSQHMPSAMHVHMIHRCMPPMTRNRNVIIQSGNTINDITELY